MNGRISEEEKYWVALNMVLGVGKTLFYRLVDRFQSARSVFRASLSELMEVEGIGRKTAEQIRGFDLEARLEREWVLLDRLQAGVVTLNSPGYPALLRAIYDPPPVLYYQGTEPVGFPLAIAVVGTRTVSNYGKQVTHRLCSQLASRGVTLVSGMARGVDTLVHRAALENGMSTLAVFGCGLDYTYPPENRNLRSSIVQSGCVISEFPVSTRPDRNNFPARNRVISGLSLGTVVIEAGEKSGALITADFALEQGREVFAVPGNINSPNSKGTNNLIRSGAKMVLGVDSILEELPGEIRALLDHATVNPPALPDDLSQNEKKLLSVMTASETPIDILIAQSGLSAAEVSATLVELELRNLVRQTDGKKFINNHAEVS